MAVKVIKRTYTDLFRPNESTDWLLGNVGDWQKLTLQLEVGAEIIGSNSETVSINTEEKTITLNSGSLWSQFGFDIGDQCSLKYRLTTVEDGLESISEIIVDFTILLDLGDTIEYDGGNGFIDIEYALIPTDRGNERVSNVRIYTVKEFEGSRITFGHLLNDTVENDNLNSFIDGTTAELKKVGLNNLTENIWSNMEDIGLQSGMSIRKSRIRKIPNPNSSSPIVATFTADQQSFNIETIFEEFFGGNLFINAQRSARPIVMALDNAFDDHQDVTGTSQITNEFTSQGLSFQTGIAQNKMFIYNIQGNLVQQYNVSIIFTVQSTNDNSSSDSINLVVYRYGNGASLDYIDRTVIKEFQNASSLVGAGFQFYVGPMTIFGADGQSFALCLEYDHPQSSSTGERRVNIQNLTGTISIPESFDQNSFYKRYYEIEMDYLISSFFESVQNLDDRIAPSYLIGDGSLTDNFDIKFFPEWNNPNTIVKNLLSETRRLGNTGWFDENFNELENEYVVSSVVYRNSDGNVVNSIDYTQETNVEIRIQGIQNLNQDSRFGFGFMHVPQDEAQYSEKETPFYRNIFLSNGSYEQSYELTSDLNPTVYFGAGIGNASMQSQNIHFRQEGNDLVFSVKLVPNTEFSSFFEAIGANDRRYAIYVSVADSTLPTRNQSDRVTLLADVNDMVKIIPPAGPYDLTTIFLEHPLDENNAGSETLEAITQDDVLTRSRFKIALSDNIQFQLMTFAVEMENAVTGQVFNLENYTVDLSSSPVDGNGFQVFQIDQTRGFRLNDGNNKNFVKVLVNEDGSTDLEKAYVAMFGFKVRYEDWIQKANVPNDFFDTAEGEDGRANDWFDYINTPDSEWSIKFSVYIQANVDSEILLYRNASAFSLKDYNQNDNVTTAVRYIRDVDDTVLNIGNDSETGNPLGVILENDLTRIECDFIITDDGTWINGNVYGTITIEIDKGAGIYEMHQISSVYVPETENPLQPLENETKLKLEIDNTNKKITSSCLVDSELLEDAVRYRVTGRIGCFEGGDIIEETGIYGSEYAEEYE